VPRAGTGWDEHAYGDRLGCEPTDSDLVEGFGDDAVQGLAGEPCEVDHDPFGLEGAFQVWA
jgi:hypothetical protein